ncbi:GNAT family N-acetyltransferase [Aureimonas jatrophae]|uniref:Acetyltransferase (GNAT) domain-containing protein n=1 Tax=Aureimonas jatrophae TaxID=1166073 RepID=A0A1H0IEA7_9HYPH|nr:GNAT family N-acetyltransferase [Aureimonas jatrophae]MBB3952121.1 hypothetical protein [Aureimonas jatrophae]SDO29754.1 Acetyltransferase (GNAT) domain-containing protein [Aureimonas jatrophae]
MTDASTLLRHAGFHGPLANVDEPRRPTLVASPSIDAHEVLQRLPVRRSYRFYDAHAALELVDELQFLMTRAVEPNVFFEPRFLVPAMPRLDERKVRLLVARDESGDRSRLRFFMPFTVERPSRSVGSILRAWSHPFGPVGTLPLDGDDPLRTARDLLTSLREPSDLPSTLVLPDMRLGGPLVAILCEAVAAEGLSIAVCDRRTRAALRPGTPLPARHRRERDRLLRRLGRHGPVRFEEARKPDDVREGLEEFLALEASGWKGRRRTALAQDRYRAAFAREAVNGLAERGQARVFTLWAGEDAAASLVVLESGGEAAAWKTAYDERFAASAPGAIVLSLAADRLLADPTIQLADSCAVPDHPVANRLWRSRTEVGTLVIGLRPGQERATTECAQALTDLRRRLHRRYRWLRRLRQALRLD